MLFSFWNLANVDFLCSLSHLFLILILAIEMVTNKVTVSMIRIPFYVAAISGTLLYFIFFDEYLFLQHSLIQVQNIEIESVLWQHVFLSVIIGALPIAFGCLLNYWKYRIIRQEVPKSVSISDYTQTKTFFKGDPPSPPKPKFKKRTSSNPDSEEDKRRLTSFPLSPILKRKKK